MICQQYTTWVEIDLGAIRNNVSLIKEKTGVQVLAVVKANAYGHGAIEVARSAIEGGATWLGVARFEEALALRKAGITAYMLVMGYTQPACVPQAIQEQIRLSVYDWATAQAYAVQAQGCEPGLYLHVKVDSGMGRLGIFPSETLELLRRLEEQPGLVIEGIFTHFARADEPQLDTTHQQLGRFIELLSTLKVNNLCPPLVHASNSAGSLFFPEANFDLVRPGISIYGLHPAPTALLSDEFRPALTWKAVLTNVKTLPPDSGVSYGHRYITTRNELIGTLPVGYADGFRRVDGNRVLVDGKRVPVIGRICMDQSAVQLDTVPGAKIGDEVVLIGRQGEETIWAEEIAERWGTINYEVTCGLAHRLPRIYKS